MRAGMITLSLGRGNRGFTLFELVITLVVVGVLAGIAAPLLFGGFMFFRSSTTDLNTQDKLRYATERMARELREVQNVAGTYTIAMAAPTVANLNFTKSDGSTVTFNGSAPPLLTMTDSTVAGTYTLTDQVAAGGASFTGYEIDGVTTTNDPTAIAFVEITLTLLRPPDNVTTFSQRTRVALRNQT